MDKDAVLTIVDEDEKPTIKITHEPTAEGGVGSTRIFIGGRDISCIVRDVDFHHSSDSIPVVTLELLAVDIATLGLEFVQHLKLQEDQEQAILWVAEKIRRRRAHAGQPLPVEVVGLPFVESKVEDTEG